MNSIRLALAFVLLLTAASVVAANASFATAAALPPFSGTASSPQPTTTAIERLSNSSLDVGAAQAIWSGLAGRVDELSFDEEIALPFVDGNASVRNDANEEEKARPQLEKRSLQGGVKEEARPRYKLLVDWSSTKQIPTSQMKTDFTKINPRDINSVRGAKDNVRGEIGEIYNNKIFDYIKSKQIPPGAPPNTPPKYRLDKFELAEQVKTTSKVYKPEEHGSIGVYEKKSDGRAGKKLGQVDSIEVVEGQLQLVNVKAKAFTNRVKENGVEKTVIDERKINDLDVQLEKEPRLIEELLKEYFKTESAGRLLRVPKDQVEIVRATAQKRGFRIIEDPHYAADFERVASEIVESAIKGGGG